ncbi:MAG: EthD domain-containing protein [Acidimicrobiia bacterium]
MKVVLTFDADGERGAAPPYTDALVAEARRLVDTGAAERAAVNVRYAGDDYDEIRDQDTARGVAGMVELWGVDTATALGFAWPDGVREVGVYRVDEVEQKSYERTWGAGEPSPGTKILCFVHRRKDITHDEFCHHWQHNHGPLAVARQPGFWHYVQNQVSETLTDDSPYWDGIGELHFRRAGDTLTGMFDSEEGQRLIYEDIPRFLALDEGMECMTREYLVP